MEDERGCLERWHLSWGWENRICADILHGKTIGKRQDSSWSIYKPGRRDGVVKEVQKSDAFL